MLTKERLGEKMQSLLAKMKTDIDRYCMIIAQILDIDVDIVDNEYNTISRSGFYQDCFSPNIYEHAFLYRDTVASGEKVKVYLNPRGEHCQACPKRDKCAQTFQIVAPIYLENTVIGIIGLMGMTEKQKERCLAESVTISSFLQQTASLIGSKAALIQEYEKQRNLTQAFRYIVESAGEGVIIMNHKSDVVFINDAGTKILGLEKNDESAILCILETDNRIMHYDEFEVQTKERSIHVAGTMWEVDINEWNRVFVFQDRQAVHREYGKFMVGTETAMDSIIGESESIVALKALISTVAPSSSTVLIQGESGTGKEVFARALHQESDRKKMPFVALNCAAVPETLLESELFGYVKGAFTGADPQGKIGKFELANGGTLFLDEIGDMPLFIQAKILRALEEREIVRLGDNKAVKVDVRIISATHKNLRKMVHEKQFREDLYYRLNVIPIHIPPLREREGDITLLANFFLAKYAERLQRVILSTDPEFYSILEKYSWPGNVRELQNVIEYVVNMMERRGKPSIPLLKKRIAADSKNTESEEFNLQEIERRTIQEALNKYEPMGYSREEIAQKLGIGPATLYRKIAKYNVNAQSSF